ncbi:MAG: DUF948 domain-containing protein [Coriobacteriia bacterium]|nr:DUF948 domain-containing protein [Coriobacteriia bacterium]
MDINYLYIALIVVGVAVGIALVWFIIELIMTLRKARKKVDEVHKQLNPTIDNIEQITKKVQPTIEKVDPLIERISLSIDAANLELMRADQILENVNVITEGVANATTSVGNIVSAPADLISKAGEKIQGILGNDNKTLDDSDVAGHLEDGEPGHGQVFTRKVKKKKKVKKVKTSDPYITVN